MLNNDVTEKREAIKVTKSAISDFLLTWEYTIFQNQTVRSITLHINMISLYVEPRKIITGISLNDFPLC